MKTAVQICRECQVSEQLLTSWKKQLRAHADLLLADSHKSFCYQPAEADEREAPESVNQLAARFPINGS